MSTPTKQQKADPFCAVCEGADPYDPPHSVCVCPPGTTLTPEAVKALGKVTDPMECPDNEWDQAAAPHGDHQGPAS